jgi:uncharacterized protein
VQQNKIINDPVHGFIEIPKGILLDLIDTDAFQRLRRIKQLALSSLVYPGAVHSRFNHCIGAMHLTGQALDVLRSKDIAISAAEYEGTLIAILLHDIGHGPFSHALESVILKGLHHERMSKAIMLELNAQFEGRLDLAIEIFEGRYPRKFLHQLVSSQLDMDRMDYLKRDSYFTGVVEGVVSASRIIKTLNVFEDRLVVEGKGILSVEKFIVARRLMYWQVYLHKAVVAAEYMIVRILERAKSLIQAGVDLWKTETLEFLFSLDMADSQTISSEVLSRYLELDDNDIMVAIKQWNRSKDPVLAFLCGNLLRRKLLKAKIQDHPFSDEEVATKRAQCAEQLGMDEAQITHIVFTGEISNSAYLPNVGEDIEILFKDGTIRNLTEASDMPMIAALSNPVKKHFLCFPTQ